MKYTSLSEAVNAPHVSGESNFYIEFKDWSKILGYAKAAQKEYKSEISGMMIVSDYEDGDYLLSHPAILKQSVSAALTTIDKEALAHYYTKAFRKHGKDIKFVWWHSHGDMGAFMSFRDEKTIQEYANGDWSLSLVINIYGSYELRLQIYNPLNFAVKTNLDILNHPVNKPASQAILNEVKDKITNTPIVTPFTRKSTPLLPPYGDDSNSLVVKEELEIDFAPRLYSFVANALADYRDGRMDYDRLKRILIDIDSFSAYFNYYVDCPTLLELDNFLRKEKNPARLMVFKFNIEGDSE